MNNKAAERKLPTCQKFKRNAKGPNDIHELFEKRMNEFHDLFKDSSFVKEKETNVTFFWNQYPDNIVRKYVFEYNLQCILGLSVTILH